MNFKHIVILIIFLAVLGAGIYFFTRKDGTEDDAKADVNKNNLTYSKSYYSQWADTIAVEAPKIWRTNGSVKTIIEILAKLKNRDDWNQLVYKFGKRSTTGIPTIWDENLGYWLNATLQNGSYEYEKDGTQRKADGLLMAKTLLEKINVTI